MSVSLPTWAACVAYEEGEKWVLKKMNNGYPRYLAVGSLPLLTTKIIGPRFFVDGSITSFTSTLIKRCATPDKWAILLPSRAVANRCASFFQYQFRSLEQNLVLETIDLIPTADPQKEPALASTDADPIVSAVIYPKQHFAVAKSFWQHTGEGISSRRAELCHKAFNEGFLTPRMKNNKTYNGLVHQKPKGSFKGPRRYQKGKMAHNVEDLLPLQPAPEASSPKEPCWGADDIVQFVEERYGRNLDFSLAARAKLAIRRRIAGTLTADGDLSKTTEMIHSATDIRQVPGFSEDDVYLFPSGMSSIFNAHRIMLACRGEMKSICFGFPYIDTLKILEKWGPGCQFYGNGSAGDLDDLESRCEKGERFLALFCEFPGNPLLKCPDLRRIRALADRFDFAVVIDETIGNFLNINVLPQADIVVSSLTKVFSGDSNVMGGRCV